MKNNCLVLLAAALLVEALTGCSDLKSGGSKAETGNLRAATNAIQTVKVKYAPDAHIGIFKVGAEERGGGLVLTGEVDQAQAKLDVVRAVEGAGAKATDQIKLLPEARLGDQVWGISCLSVASAREQPEHKAEMGTQIWMGNVVRVLKRSSNAIFSWYQIQSADGYVAWVEKGGLMRCTREQADAWQQGPLLIVTAFEDRILERPQADALPVSDVVVCDLVKKVGEEGDWVKVELPDKRAGFIPKASTTDYADWKKSRQATADNIEHTARLFVGRPYLWGGNSPKGVDCSGFSKTVFFLNGIDLRRNASEQALEGTDVPLDDDLSHLKKGDLLFFGRRSRRGGPARVTHVGIYLGNKMFIQSSQRVRICSLDPKSPDADDYRIESLIKARRVLPDQ
jgi:hypothetical protein